MFVLTDTELVNLDHTKEIALCEYDIKGQFSKTPRIRFVLEYNTLGHPLTYFYRTFKSLEAARLAYRNLILSIYKVSDVIELNGESDEGG